MFYGCIAALILSAMTVAGAQEKTAPVDVRQAAPAATPVPLKIQFVISRYQGEKKLSSAPYVLWVTANERDSTRLRMGVEVPVAMNATQMNYRPIGTNIDCTATRTSGSGAFKVNVSITSTSVLLRSTDVKGADPQVDSAPSFGSFSGTFTILLNDGQTAQYTSATDPVSGEVLKVEATLNVLK
jgi:hypothetical protein